jgi:citrate lyase subunit beta/citryl-CoA lyase
VNPRTPLARPRRSALYLPADKTRAIEKARGLRCDVVILDLEDAVQPDGKVGARQQAVAAVEAGLFGAREVMVRVNGIDTEWGLDDLRALKTVRPDAVLVPKVSTPDALADYLPHLRDDVHVWSMIETCCAVMRVADIAAMSRQCALSGFVIGTNDLAKEMRCALDAPRAPLLAALSLAVIAARANGIGVLDGVYNELEDDAGLQAQCAQGAAFGFDGKTLVHPRQIEAANRAFSPSAADIERSRAIVRAFTDPTNAAKGVLSVDGRMVELLHLEIARQTLAIAEQIEALEAAHPA